MEIGKDELKKLLENKAEETYGDRKKNELLEIKHDKEMMTFKDIEKWKTKKNNRVIRTNQVDIYENHLNLVLESNINSLVCVSRTGIGKTYATLNILRKQGKEYAYKNGFSTALSLYQYIYDNRDKLIVIDDLTDNIFKDKKIIAILKACLYGESNKRFVNYDTTSDKLSVPNRFEFTGKVIILANEIGNKHSEDFKALISRGIFFEMSYSFKETISIAYKIIRNNKLTDKQNVRIKQIIKDNVTSVCEFNFRKLEHLIEMVKFDMSKAEELFINSYKVDEDTRLVEQLIQRASPVKDQAREFTEKTGKSRRTYFTIKKKISAVVQSKNNVALALRGSQ